MDSFHLIGWSVAVRETAVLERFGRRVRALRVKHGWTQEVLAEKAGLHENYISRLETGRQEAGLLTITKLAKAFGMKPGELLD